MRSMNFLRLALRRALLMLTWRPVSMRRSKRSFQNLGSPRQESSSMSRSVSSPLLLPASPPPSTPEVCWFVEDQEEEYVFVRDEYEDDDQEVPLGITALSAVAAACTCFFSTKKWYDHSASPASRMLCLFSIVCLSLSAAAIIVLSASALSYDEYYEEQEEEQRQEEEEAKERERSRGGGDEQSGGERDDDDRDEDEMRTAVELIDACRRSAPEVTAIPRSSSTSHGGPLTHVLSFDLDMAAADTFKKYWATLDDNNNGTFYTRFLQEQVKNKNPLATDWEDAGGQGARRRLIETLHPLATSIRLPGLALVIPTVKRQIAFEMKNEADDLALAVFERSKFKDIPYAGALRVETVWLFFKDTTVHVYFRCVFLTKVLKVPPWIQRLASRNTKTELNTTYSKWRDAVRQDILREERARRGEDDPGTLAVSDQPSRGSLRSTSSSSSVGRRGSRLPPATTTPPPFSLDSSSLSDQHRSLDDIFCFRKPQRQAIDDDERDGYMTKQRSSFSTAGEFFSAGQQHRRSSYYQQRTSRLLASCAEDDEELNRQLQNNRGGPNARFVSAPHETTSADRTNNRRRQYRASSFRSSFEHPPAKLHRRTTDSSVDYAY